MRMSDGSSDVCSSDLHLQIVRAEAALREKLGVVAYRFHTVHDRHSSCGEEHLVRPDDYVLFVSGDKHLIIVCAVVFVTEGRDRKSTRLYSSHYFASRIPSFACFYFSFFFSFFLFF